MAGRPSEITSEWLDDVRKRLTDLPPPVQTRFSRQQAITELAPVIEDLRARKYRLEDILPVLNTGGQSFTVGALKTYLARVPPSMSAPQERAPSPGSPKAPRKSKALSAPVIDSVGKPPADSAGAGARLRAPKPEGDILE